TEAGQMFYERSLRGLQEIEAAEAEVSRLQAEPRGVLRLNTPMSFGILHIAPALADFMRCYPEISVDMNLDDRQVDIIEEGFDVSVRISDLPDSALIARRIAPCRHAIVASPEYLAQYGTPQTPEDLHQHNIVSYRLQESANEWHFKDKNNRTYTIPVSGSVKMNNSLALREALLGGIGITRTPTFIVGKDIQEGRLQQVLTNYESLEIQIYLVYPQRQHLSPKVRAFVDYFAERISDPPYWDQ
ncbi:MAG: substrate binding domain-containing protein, partial [Pseudomonadales bacterium]